MLGSKSEHQSSETIIGLGVEVEGNFVSQDRVVVEGKVKGSIKTSGDLEVGAQAVVEAEVAAQNVSVGGTIKGNVKAKERLELREGAAVIGDVEAKVLIIAANATLNGYCQMPVEGSEMPTREKDNKRKKREQKEETKATEEI